MPLDPSLRGKKTAETVLLSAKVAMAARVRLRPRKPAWTAFPNGCVAACCVAEPADVVILDGDLCRLGRLPLPAAVQALAPLARGPAGAVVASLIGGSALVVDVAEDSLVPMRRKQTLAAEAGEPFRTDPVVLARLAPVKIIDASARLAHVAVAETAPPVAFGAMDDGRIVAWPLVARDKDFPDEEIQPCVVFSSSPGVVYNDLSASAHFEHVDGSRPKVGGEGGGGGSGAPAEGEETGQKQTEGVQKREPLVARVLLVYEEVGATLPKCNIMAIDVAVPDLLDAQARYLALERPNESHSPEERHALGRKLMEVEHDRHITGGDVAVSCAWSETACSPYGRVLSGVTAGTNGCVVFGGEDDCVYETVLNQVTRSDATGPQEVAPRPRRVLIGQHDGYASSVAFRGGLVVSAGTDSRLILWSTEENGSCGVDSGVVLMELAPGQPFCRVLWPTDDVLYVSANENTQGKSMLFRVQLLVGDEDDLASESTGPEPEGQISPRVVPLPVQALGRQTPPA